MADPNFRMLIRNLRLMDEAKKAGKCHACGQKLPKPKTAPKPRCTCKDTYEVGSGDRCPIHEESN